jgi:PBP1b-binding outer membrane lipoprotein LpoB
MDLKMKKLIVLLASIGLILALVLTGCAGATPEPEVIEKTVTKTETVEVNVEVEKTFQYLNPRGDFIPVELHPLAPRLDNLDGKRILYYQSEANPVMMPILLERLRADHPTSTFDVIITEQFGAGTPTEEQLEYDAIIRGISW